MAASVRWVFNHLPQIVPTVEGGMKSARLRAARRIYKRSQQLVPVDTEKLKLSGAVEAGVVTYGTDYAVHVHDGTSKMPARPFLAQALIQETEGSVREIAEELDAKLRNLGG